MGEPTDDQYGFVPSNYIEYTGAQSSALAGQDQTDQAAPYSSSSNLDKPLPNFPPPPKSHYASASPSVAETTHHTQARDEDEEDAPPMPARPSNNRTESSNGDRRGQNRQQSSSQNFASWSVQEVDGRKKNKATLSVGNGLIMYSPDRSGSEPQQWEAQDLISHSLEKKHVFLEFQHPRASLDLHAGSKDVAEEIINALGEIAGVGRANGLREVYVAVQSAGQKMGKVLYDFEAQGDDEISVKEGENVFILDDKKSKEWWIVRSANGDEGVMPSSYIELAAEPSDSKRLSLPFSRKKNTSSNGGSSSLARNTSKRLSRRLSTKEPERPERDDHRKSKSNGHSGRSKPDMAKVRTWTDRSGTFKVEAELLGCADGKIHLHKLNGVQIAVSASKMSLDDLEYVERVTGVRLDDDKPLVDLRKGSGRSDSRSRSRGANQHSSGVPGGVSTGVSKTSKSASATSLHSAVESQVGGRGASSKPEYDWFGFFLDCGVDVNNCQRYSINFSRDQMDENILPDINASVLRNLGLKEGDILRVTKKLDETFGRTKPEVSSQGGLFSGAGGALLNNTNKQAHGAASSSSVSLHENPTKPAQLSSSAPRGKQGFEDDAWAIKGGSSDEPPPQPARPQQPTESSRQSSAPAQPLQSAQPAVRSQAPPAPQPTGSMRDLMGLQPLVPEKTAQSIAADSQFRQQQMQMQKNTQSQIEFLQQQQMQQQNLINKLQAQNTQNQIQQQQLVSQLTGGNPFNNPIGIQNTGQPLVANNTGKSILGPFSTGNSMPLSMSNTGGFGQQPTGGFGQQPTGGFAQQPTGVFGQQPGVFGQPTGGFVQQPTNGFAQQPTGVFASQPIGGFTSQTSGMMGQQQMSSPFVQQPIMGQNTGGFNGNPLNRVPTGGGSSASLPMATGMNPFFNQQGLYQNTPAVNYSGQSMNMMTNQFDQVNLNGQQNMTTQPFSQPGAPAPQASFGQQPPQSFNQQLQPQSTGFGFGNSATTFGGSTFGDLNTGASVFNQSLQPQATGNHPQVSFGGPQPLQPQSTGNRRANLAAATPNNPFGF